MDSIQFRFVYSHFNDKTINISPFSNKQLDYWETRFNIEVNSFDNYKFMELPSEINHIKCRCVKSIKVFFFLLYTPVRSSSPKYISWYLFMYDKRQENLLRYSKR